VHRKATKPEFLIDQAARLGERLRQRRRNSRLTPAEAAKLIGVRRWTFGLWETGVQEPRAGLRPAIDRFLE